MGNLGLKSTVVLLLLCVASLFAKAINPPIIAIDSTNFSLKINNKSVEPTKLNDLLRIIDREYRKVERSDKVLYIFDEYGFTLIKEKKGITFSFLFSKGLKDDEPNNAFNLELFVNKQVVNSNSSINDIKQQLPKADKALHMENMFIYIHKKMVCMYESKDGKFIRFDIGYKAK